MCRSETKRSSRRYSRQQECKLHGCDIVSFVLHCIAYCYFILLHYEMRVRKSRITDNTGSLAVLKIRPLYLVSRLGVFDQDDKELKKRMFSELLRFLVDG